MNATVVTQPESATTGRGSQLTYEQRLSVRVRKELAKYAETGPNAVRLLTRLEAVESAVQRLIQYQYERLNAQSQSILRCHLRLLAESDESQRWLNSIADINAIIRQLDSKRDAWLDVAGAIQTYLYHLRAPAQRYESLIDPFTIATSTEAWSQVRCLDAEFENLKDRRSVLDTNLLKDLNEAVQMYQPYGEAPRDYLVLDIADLHVHRLPSVIDYDISNVYETTKTQLSSLRTYMMDEVWSRAEIKAEKESKHAVWKGRDLVTLSAGTITRLVAEAGERYNKEREQISKENRQLANFEATVKWSLPANSYLGQDLHKWEQIVLARYAPQFLRKRAAIRKGK